MIAILRSCKDGENRRRNDEIYLCSQARTEEKRPCEGSLFCGLMRGRRGAGMGGGFPSRRDGEPRENGGVPPMGERHRWIT